MGSVPYVNGHIDAVTTDVLNVWVIHDCLEWAVSREVSYYIIEDSVPLLDCELAEASVVFLCDDLGLLVYILLDRKSVV